MRFSFQGGTYSLGQLLPMRFKPADLLPDPATPLLLQPQDNGVQLTAAARELLHARAGDAAFERAAAEALAEAVGSYSPYSRCPAGLAIVTQGGGVYSGGYVESAAYNPSLPPLQTAIVDAVIGAHGVCGWRWGATMLRQAPASGAAGGKHCAVLFLLCSPSSRHRTAALGTYACRPSLLPLRRRHALLHRGG